MGSGEPSAGRLRIVAIVLAAGEGRRFGGAKQLAEVDGEAMVARVTREALAVEGLAEVVVVTGAHGEDVAAALPGGGERVVQCGAWADGIGASIACGLAAAGAVDGALVLLGDQPLVDRALIAQVLAAGGDALAGDEYDAARPIGPGGAPGHPVLLGPTAMVAARRLSGDAGVLGTLSSSRVFRLPTTGTAATFDVDVPSDLVVARAMVADRGAAAVGAEPGAGRQRDAGTETR